MHNLRGTTSASERRRVMGSEAAHRLCAELRCDAEQSLPGIIHKAVTKRMGNSQAAWRCLTAPARRVLEPWTVSWAPPAAE